MTDDCLRRCAIHGPELAAYVREIVEREQKGQAEAEVEIHDDDDGAWDEG